MEIRRTQEIEFEPQPGLKVLVRARQAKTNLWEIHGIEVQKSTKGRAIEHVFHGSLMDLQTRLADLQAVVEAIHQLPL